MTLQVWNHHKCATGSMTRVLNAIATANGLRYMMDHRGDSDIASMRAGADVLHIKNAHVGMLADPGASGIHVVRNPFSVVVSGYYSHRKTHAIRLTTGTWSKLAAQRDRLAVLDKRDGLTATIEFLLDPEFYPGTPGPLHALANWPYDDPRFTALRMEDFVTAPATRLLEAAERSGLDCSPFISRPDDSEFLFEQVSGGRSVGQVDESSHYRSGDPNDWRNHLEPQHVAAIRKACRPVFERFYPEFTEAEKTLVSGADLATLHAPDPPSDTATVKIGDISLCYRKNDGGGTHYLGRVHAEEYHSPIYRLLRDALSPAACIDIGANYGYTGLLMHKAFPRARLTLVEPVPWLEPYVRHNFAMNGASFAHFNSAICSTPSATGTSQFGVQDKGTQDSRVVPQRGATIVDTRVVTLDALCADIAPQEGVYIKIDTQGWEEHVFSGGEAFLSTHRRWFAKTEFAPQWLESQGSDPVALLQWLLARYAVHESVGRVRFGCATVDEAIGPPLVQGCEREFVSYVRNLALNDKGWIDLFVLPMPDRRGYDISLGAPSPKWRTHD